MMDYFMGALLIVAPWLFQVGPGAPTWIMVILGVGAIGYSLMTDYELGAIRLISMPAHLAMDAASGLLLALSPWLFGFSDLVWIPHMILGLLEIGAAATTQTRPAYGSLTSGGMGTGVSPRI